MKVCPACRTTFDDSQNFCLNDGTPLVAAGVEQDTVIAPDQNVIVKQSGYGNLPPAAAASPAAQPRPTPARSKNGLLIAATALLTVLLIGAGAVGWWYLSRNRAAANQNAGSNANLTLNSNAAARVSTSVANSAANTANSAVVLSNASNVQTSPSPARPVASPDAAEIREETSEILNSWADALSSNNLSGHLNYYADTLDYYYNSRGTSRNQVRADKQRAFAQFDAMEMNISNVRVTPDESGERATIVYDKQWYFEGENKTNEGKTQSQLELRKINGRWLIVGERDIKVYDQQSY